MTNMIEHWDGGWHTYGYADWYYPPPRVILPTIKLSRPELQSRPSARGSLALPLPPSARICTIDPPGQRRGLWQWPGSLADRRQRTGGQDIQQLVCYNDGNNNGWRATTQARGAAYQWSVGPKNGDFSPFFLPTSAYPRFVCPKRRVFVSPILSHTLPTDRAQLDSPVYGTPKLPILVGK